MKKINVLLSCLSLVIAFLVTATSVRALSNSEILSAVNETRTSNGMTTLTLNSKLQSAAAMKLADIQQYHYWAHNNPTTGATWSSFIKKTGYRGFVGENLASNLNSAQAVMSAWLNSPTHKANILSTSYKEVGIAIGEADLGYGNEIVVVTEFGSGTVKNLQARR